MENSQVSVNKDDDGEDGRLTPIIKVFAIKYLFKYILSGFRGLTKRSTFRSPTFNSKFVYSDWTSATDIVENNYFNLLEYKLSRGEDLKWSHVTVSKLLEKSGLIPFNLFLQIYQLKSNWFTYNHNRLLEFQKVDQQQGEGEDNGKEQQQVRMGSYRSIEEEFQDEIIEDACKGGSKEIVMYLISKKKELLSGKPTVVSCRMIENALQSKSKDLIDYLLEMDVKQGKPMVTKFNSQVEADNSLYNKSFQKECDPWYYKKISQHFGPMKRSDDRIRSRSILLAMDKDLLHEMYPPSPQNTVILLSILKGFNLENVDNARFVEFVKWIREELRHTYLKLGMKSFTEPLEEIYKKYDIKDEQEKEFIFTWEVFRMAKDDVSTLSVDWIPRGGFGKGLFQFIVDNSVEAHYRYIISVIAEQFKIQDVKHFWSSLISDTKRIEFVNITSGNLKQLLFRKDDPDLDIAYFIHDCQLSMEKIVKDSDKTRRAALEEYNSNEDNEYREPGLVEERFEPTQIKFRAMKHSLEITNLQQLRFLILLHHQYKSSKDEVESDILESISLGNAVMTIPMMEMIKPYLSIWDKDSQSNKFSSTLGDAVKNSEMHVVKYVIEDMKFSLGERNQEVVIGCILFNRPRIAKYIASKVGPITYTLTKERRFYEALTDLGTNGSIECFESIQEILSDSESLKWIKHIVNGACSDGRLPLIHYIYDRIDQFNTLVSQKRRDTKVKQFESERKYIYSKIFKKRAISMAVSNNQWKTADQLMKWRKEFNLFDESTEEALSKEIPINYPQLCKSEVYQVIHQWLPKHFTKDQIKTKLFGVVNGQSTQNRLIQDQPNLYYILLDMGFEFISSDKSTKHDYYIDGGNNNEYL